jgi:YfiH family protein
VGAAIVLDLIRPGWAHAGRVAVVTSTRHGGVSLPPYDSLNLAEHVGDAQLAVAENRRRLLAEIGERPVQWLRQVHGTRVVAADGGSTAGIPEADGAWTSERGVAVAVLTADCLPIVLVARGFEALAVVHAGWRGLAGGVLAAACESLPGAPGSAWVGPGIGAARYEVGGEVLAEVRALGPYAEASIRPAADPGKGYLDLAGLATLQLRSLGFSDVHCDRSCTADTPSLFSYRRDGVTGRMATLAWLR